MWLTIKSCIRDFFVLTFFILKQIGNKTIFQYNSKSLGGSTWGLVLSRHLIFIQFRAVSRGKLPK